MTLFLVTLGCSASKSTTSEKGKDTIAKWRKLNRKKISEYGRKSWEKHGWKRNKRKRELYASNEEYRKHKKETEMKFVTFFLLLYVPKVLYCPEVAR